MRPLELIRLPPLMALGTGSPEVAVALLDGPVATQHADLASARIQGIPTGASVECVTVSSRACRHGTFVAGILAAERGSAAPAICPACTLLVRPIFGEHGDVTGMPGATPLELSDAIVDCVDGGARILNLSASTERPSTRGERAVEQSLHYAARRGVLVVAAAGNQGTLGSSAITRHPWVIPVMACDLRGQPMRESNLGSSIGRRGIGGPGKGIVSLGAEGEPVTFDGTSFAAAFISGAIALLWSKFLSASAQQIKSAVLTARPHVRKAVVPPLLDAWAAYEVLAYARRGRELTLCGTGQS